MKPQFSVVLPASAARLYRTFDHCSGDQSTSDCATTCLFRISGPRSVGTQNSYETVWTRWAQAWRSPSLEDAVNLSRLSAAIRAWA